MGNCATEKQLQRCSRSPAHVNDGPTQNLWYASECTTTCLHMCSFFHPKPAIFAPKNFSLLCSLRPLCGHGDFCLPFDHFHLWLNVMFYHWGTESFCSFKLTHTRYLGVCVNVSSGHEPRPNRHLKCWEFTKCKRRKVSEGKPRSLSPSLFSLMNWPILLEKWRPRRRGLNIWNSRCSLC